MNTMLEALKKAGIEIEEDKDTSKTINKNFLLPFNIPSFDEEYNYTLEDEMKFIQDNWFSILEEEIISYNCDEGENIKNLLIRKLDKVKVIEKTLNDEPFSSLFFFFEYQPLVKRFLIRGNMYGLEKVCEYNNISYKDFTYLKDEKKREAIAFYLANQCDNILLYINNADTIMAFLDIPYTFEEIQKDEYAMKCLHNYLERTEFKPNPKKKYFIVADYDFMFLTPKYYLKKAN